MRTRLPPALTLVASLLALAPGHAQSVGLVPLAQTEVDIRKGGRPQTLAQIGGLNNPQPATLDIDGDGALDYYVFDRAGDAHIAFTAAAAAGEYRLLGPETVVWPPGVSFSLLRDFNGDGVPDLFTHAREIGKSGLLAYEGFRQDGVLRFRAARQSGAPDDALYYLDQGDQRLMYVAVTDLPAIVDLDGDGDLDVVSFDVGGGYMEHYENISAPGSPGLRFARVSACYGGVYETNLDGLVNLAAAPGACAQPFAPDDPSGGMSARSGIHPGSTITPYDVDGDGDLDLLLGDVNSGFVTQLENRPSSGTTYFADVRYDWPPASPVDIDNFPAVFPIDLPERPGEPAFLVSPSNPGGGENYDVLWLYGPSDGDPDLLTLQQRDYLADRAFDHGAGAHMAIGDLTGDGRDDLLVGNDAYYLSPQSSFAEFALYVALPGGGYAEQLPAWLPRLNAGVRGVLLGLDPALADVDGDGDLDLVFGNDQGTVAFARNTAAAGAAADFASPDLSWMGIDVGTQSSPALADLDGDGLLDLLVGERRGKLAYFPNRGTATAPAFAATADEEQYGAIDVRVPGFARVETRPAFARVQGQTVLYVGTRQGRLLAYGQLPASAGGAARPLAEIELGAGGGLSPAFAKTSAPTTPLAFVGTSRGGGTFYRLEALVDVAEPTLAAAADWTVAPNPSTGDWRLLGAPAGATAEVYDIAGRRIARFRADAEGAPRLPAGAYTVRLLPADSVGDGGEVGPAPFTRRLVVLAR